MRENRATDPDYGSSPLEELTRADTHKIRVGDEVFSEDFPEEEPTKADIDEETLRNGQPGKALRVRCECGQWTTFDAVYRDACFMCVSRKAGL